ncbi:hypothetical protein A2U01_0009996 [Trifolium medium]|uniref:Uncharacterized protein n=1 Tax=Trifolium medium TaxID=97028 RepID=A0A392MPE7_9FABA|nr:hypothetical protein [Trifolium medium]
MGLQPKQLRKSSSPTVEHDPNIVGPRSHNGHNIQSYCTKPSSHSPEPNGVHCRTRSTLLFTGTGDEHHRTNVDSDQSKISGVVCGKLKFPRHFLETRPKLPITTQIHDQWPVKTTTLLRTMQVGATNPPDKGRL